MAARTTLMRRICADFASPAAKLIRPQRHKDAKTQSEKTELITLCLRVFAPLWSFLFPHAEGVFKIRVIRVAIHAALDNQFMKPISSNPPAPSHFQCFPAPLQHSLPPIVQA